MTTTMSAENVVQARPPTAEPAKKKSKLPIIIAIVVVLAVGGYVAKGKFLKPHYSLKHPAPLGVIDDLGGGQLTVNLSDGHLVQVSLAIQLTSVADQKKIDSEVPIFQDATISVLGAQTYSSLLAPGGRQAVKQQLLERFQQIAGNADGVAQITAVYYTSFIIQ